MKFSKVSFKIFFRDYCKANNIPVDKMDDDDLILDIKDMYEKIKLPVRATKGSAGYDFFIPYTVNFNHVEGPVLVPTGIRFECDFDKFLALYPRSGLGFKYGMQLRNTVGVIDYDYFYSSNEGHSMAKVTCEESFMLEQGTAMMQGIISPYYKVDNDTSDKERDGGFGSTGM